MERNISPAAILCIVLVSLACVIGIGYGAFAITKGSANEGTQEVASQTSYASNSWKDDYDAKDVTGAQVKNLLNEAESKGIAVFVNTRGMCQGTINTQSEVPVLKHNGKYYMNYGTVFDYEDESYKKASGEVAMSGNSNLLGVRDGSSLKVDANPKLQDGKLVRNKDYTGLYANGAVNYIDTHAKFRSNLIYGNNGEVVGVILSQVNRAGATLSLSSGGGFTNGSSGMGGTSGSYIPSHSGGGNIPLTGGTVGGGSSSSGGSSVATPGSGANASGPSTKPSEPAPSVSSGEVVVTFDTRGGNVIDYQKLTSGFKVTKPTAPTRAGYGFAGWYTDSNCSSKYNFDSAVSKNITLYARWFMWGDVDNNGILNNNDADRVMEYTVRLIDDLPLYLAAFLCLERDGVENIDTRFGPTSGDASLIKQKVAGYMPKWAIEDLTSGYEFDLEAGYYYTADGIRKVIPKSRGYSASVTGAKIPEGGTYYVGVTSRVVGNYTGATQTLSAGDYFPSTVNPGDVYVYGDYEYRYEFESNGGGGFNKSEGNSWGVRVINTNKTNYGSILSSINGKDVKNLTYTFSECRSMVVSPVLPETTTLMEGTFFECYELKSTPIIPSNVTTLDCAFFMCESLTEAPVIPNKVTNMNDTFDSCSNLVSVPNIPANVSNLGMTFYACKKLTGTINVDCSNLIDLRSCFLGTELPILLTGSCNKLYDLAATSSRGNVTVYNTDSSIIPSGATYYVGDTEEWLEHYSSATAVYKAGDRFPSEVNTGDIYVYGDYEYRYNYTSNGGGGWYVDESHNGWGAKIIDTNKTEYEPALASINGKPVNDLSFTYCCCYNLEKAPKLQEG